MAHEPLLKVSRPVAACQRCRTAKTKCDGKLPACSSCERAGKAAECISTGDQFARGKERSYPAFLESKIIKLRARLAEVEKANGPRSDTTNRYNTSLSSSLTHYDPDKGSLDRPDSQPVRRRENSEINDLVSNFGVLSVNAAARDYQGFSLMSVARVSLWAITRQTRIDAPFVPLPSRAESMALGQQYLSNIFLVSPVIETSTFWASLEAVYGGYALPYHHYILRMVIATALIVQSELFGDGFYQLGGSHAMAAMNYVEDAFRPDTISSIQAMLLLVEYSRYDPRHFDNWTLVGVLTRAALDLGLHQDPPKKASVSRAKLEARRRVYMCVYCMDRLASVVFEKPLSFSDASTNVDVGASLLESQLPNNSFHTSAWLQPYEYGRSMFLIRRIQSQIWQDLHQSERTPLREPYGYIWNKWHEAHQWFDELPTGPTAVVDLAKIEMIATVIQLLAPSPRIPVSSELAQSFMFEYGIEYCQRLSAAIDDKVNYSSLPYTSGVRSRKIASICVQNLIAHGDWLLRGSVPRSDPYDRNAKAPAYHYPERNDTAERATNFVYKMAHVLNYFAQRFGVSGWREDFMRESESLLEHLIVRRR